MVTYVLIIFVTIMILTMIVHKCAPWMFRDISPKVLVLCASCACVLGLLLPQVIIHVPSMSTGVLVLGTVMFSSSYLLLRSDNSTTVGITEADTLLPAPVQMPEVEELQELFVNPDLVVDQPTLPNPYSAFESALDLSGEAVFVEGDQSADEEQPIANEHIINLMTEEVIANESRLDEAIVDVSAVDEIIEDIITDPTNESINGILESELIGMETAKESEQTDIVMDFSEYLDAAFEAKQVQNYQAATYAFLKALDTAPDDSTAIYLVAEISALLKLQGLYEQAIQQMEHGRNLALQCNSQSVANEFIEGIAYLRIVKNVLLEERIPFTPYVSLTEDIKLKIDEEFRLWRNN